MHFAHCLHNGFSPVFNLDYVAWKIYDTASTILMSLLFTMASPWFFVYLCIPAHNP